jgi:hypothetical protein
MDSPNVNSRFQERLALLVGAGMLFGLGIRKQSPPWEGVALLAAGCLLLRGSMTLLRTVRMVPPAPAPSAADPRQDRDGREALTKRLRLDY